MAVDRALRYKVVALVGVMLMAQGCNSTQMSRQDIGTVTGGVLGGLLGSQMGKGTGRTAAVIGGTILGSMMGSEVGRNMDDVNKMRVAHALETTPQNRSRSWVDQHDRYTVTPNQSFEKGSQTCRHYRISIESEGRIQQGHGTACRDQSGNWVIKESWSDR